MSNDPVKDLAINFARLRALARQPVPDDIEVRGLDWCGRGEHGKWFNGAPLEPGHHVYTSGGGMDWSIVLRCDLETVRWEMSPLTGGDGVVESGDLAICDDEDFVTAGWDEVINACNQALIIAQAAAERRDPRGVR